MRKVLITGGAGFVGRRFVHHFLRQGDEVHVVDPIVPLTGGRDPADEWPLFEPRDFPHFHFVKEDCRSFFGRRRDSDFDYAFHLAAMVGGRLMIENNPLVVADDLSIDAAYWKWAKATRPRKTVSISSSAAYPVKHQGEVGYLPLTEDMIDFSHDLGVPDLSYGWAKLTSDFIGRLAYERHGVPSVCYRPFSGYGEDQDDTYPFPSICKRALAARGQRKMIVWGTGAQMRDFIHVEDCIRGVFLTMDKIENGSAINLSTGILTSFIAFAGIAARACGYEPISIEGMTNKPSGVHARGGDVTLQRKLGFTSAIGLDEGVKRAVQYFERVR
jgi:nucleoside-diphosphate-sugar epimerase